MGIDRICFTSYVEDGASLFHAWHGVVRMSEQLIAGWGVRLVDRPCGCDGRGLQPGGQVCTCEAGKRLRDLAEQGERKVLAGDAS